jgi:hypothetical protein
MTNIVIHNALTNETVVRDANAEELAAQKKRQEKSEAIRADEQKTIDQKVAAFEKLQQLGLTADEIKALGL